MSFPFVGVERKGSAGTSSKGFRNNGEAYSAEVLGEAAAQKIEALLAGLGSSPDGLSEAGASRQREIYGHNEVAEEHQIGLARQLWRSFRNPFNLLLTVLAGVSALSGDREAALLIGIMVMLSTLLRFVQEARSTRAAEQLKAMVRTTATVTRSGKRREIPVSDLVPGDIVHLSAGDMIPADIRLLTAKDLFVSQSALTGESLPTEKFVLESTGDGAALNVLELPSICFLGTNVVSGIGTGVVVETGANTYFGAVAQRVTGQRPLTSFDKGVGKVSRLLIRFTLVMAPLVFLINGFTKGDWREAFFFAIAVAVGLTPEMLPMIVTANLARGAVALSRKKVIVKRLNAIQDFGAMDVLCSDKTGTLTQDKVILERHLDIDGHECERVLQYAYLNSYYQTGLKNLLDVAVLEHAELHESLHVATEFRLVDEIPFDFERRRMSVAVEGSGSYHLLIAKGAVEEILTVCGCADLGGRSVPLTSEVKTRVRQTVAGLNEEGLRAIAVAIRRFAVEHGSYAVADERDMTLVGYIAFLDPPKETAAAAIKGLRNHGVAVKILTGDNEIVTRRICREVGLPAGRIVVGRDIEQMEDGELGRLAEETTIFARLSPAQKARLVSALRQAGHVVGFLGDGINDAPALRAADVGISVNTAVDIAKESADLILMEKSLLVLGDGVLEGRRTFGNIVKYIQMGTSSNFGNMFSVLGASAFLPFLPMAPLQLLVQNLLYDLSQTAIPFDQVDDEYLTKPRKWEVGAIGRFMLFLGPVSSIFDYLTFFLMWYVFGATSASHQSLFQSGWFVEGLLSQTLIVHVIRTARIPFLESRASAPLLWLTGAIMAAGIAIPFTSFGASIGLSPLPRAYFGFLVAILLAYCVLAQIVKVWFARRYGYYGDEGGGIQPHPAPEGSNNPLGKRQ